MNNVKIISIEFKKSYYLVTTNVDDYEFDEDTIVKYSIFNDQEFTKEEFDKIIAFNSGQVAFNKVLRYLGYGPRSKMEIIVYLKEKGIEDYKAVVKKLCEYGYIDDNKLATELLEYYMGQNKGPLYILKKYKEKGIDDKIATTAIKNYTEEIELELANDVTKKELPKLTEYPIKKQQTKLYTLLISKGYHIDIARRMVEKSEFVDESSDNLKKDFEKYKQKANKKEFNDNELKSYIIEKLLAKGYDYKVIKTMFN